MNEDTPNIENDIMQLALRGMVAEAVGHDFNNQSNSIRFLLRRLGEETEDDKTQRYVERLTAHWASVESYIRKLYPMSRGHLESHHTNGREMWGDLEPLVVPRWEQVSFEPTDAFLGFEFAMRESDVLPVFFNLVENAAYWSGQDDGDQRVVIDRPISDADVVTVCDSGPGIQMTDRERRRIERSEERGDGRYSRKDILEKIFEPYRSRRPGGTGIGLWIVRTVVESLEGRVWASDDPKYAKLSGACFCVEVPT